MAFNLTSQLSAPNGTYRTGSVFISSANRIYVFMVDQTFGTTNVEMRPFKSNDTTPTGFTEQTDWTVSPISGTCSGACYQVGDVIHCFMHDGGTHLSYNSYSMATDTWSGVVALGTLASGSFAATVPAGAVRSNGDIIVLHAGPNASVMGNQYSTVVYSKRLSGTWTFGAAQVSPASVQQAWEPSGHVLGASNRSHFFLYYSAQSPGSVQTRSLDTTQALDTAQTLTSSVPTSANLANGNQGFYSSATGVHWGWYAGGSSTVTSFASGASPTITNTTVSTSSISGSSTIGWEPSNGNLFLAYATGNRVAPQVYDIFENVAGTAASWTSETTMATATGSSPQIYLAGNIITKADGSVVFAMVTGEPTAPGSTATYSEWQLVAAPPPAATVAPNPQVQIRLAALAAGVR